MCDDSRFGRCANHRNDVEPNIGMNICHAYEGVGSYRQRVYLLLVYGSHGIGKALVAARLYLYNNQCLLICHGYDVEVTVTIAPVAPQNIIIFRLKILCRKVK